MLSFKFTKLVVIENATNYICSLCNTNGPFDWGICVVPLSVIDGNYKNGAISNMYEVVTTMSYVQHIMPIIQ